MPTDQSPERRKAMIVAVCPTISVRTTPGMNPANEDHQGLAQEKSMHLSSSRSHGHTDPDFPSATCHVKRKQAVEPYRSNGQRQPGEERCKPRQ